MIEIIMLAGPLCHGLQLNTCWPSVSELILFRTFDSTSRLIVQIGSNALKQVAYNPQRLVDKIEDSYIDFAQYILLDPSGGTGSDMDLHKTTLFLEEIYMRGLNKRVGIGIAGGLSAERIPYLEDIFQRFPGLSIDAEGKFRTPEDEYIPKEGVQYVHTALKYM